MFTYHSLIIIYNTIVMEFPNFRLKSYWTSSGKLTRSFAASSLTSQFSVEDSDYEFSGRLYRSVTKTREELENETDSYLQPD